METPSFNRLIEQNIVDNWNLDALTDYKGFTLQTHDVARRSTTAGINDEIALLQELVGYLSRSLDIMAGKPTTIPSWSARRRMESIFCRKNIC